LPPAQPRHQRARRSCSGLDTDCRYVSTVTTVVCSDFHALIADFAVFRGTTAELVDLPHAVNAWCVIEVADASYERDAGEKLRGYALAGVGQYIIINLRNRTAEIHEQPDRATGTYAPPRVIGEEGSLPLRVGEGETVEVALRSVLP
jgi:hypothetical protein